RLQRHLGIESGTLVELRGETLSQLAHRLQHLLLRKKFAAKEGLRRNSRNKRFHGFLHCLRRNTILHPLGPVWKTTGITSRASAAISPARLGISAGSVAQHVSIRALRPMVKPRRLRAGARIRSRCCARAANGHAAAAPPRSVMKSRRRIIR